MNKKGKTSSKDITRSPYFTAAMLLVVILGIIAIIVLYMLDINKTKAELVEVRASYAENINQVSYLEELRAKSEEAEQKLAYYEGILPESLGDAYLLEENLIKTCGNFNLEVSVPEDVTQMQFSTAETTYYFNVTGEYRDIISFMQYITTLTQIHRIDKFSMTKNNDGAYVSDISITVLSVNGADGLDKTELSNKK